MLRKLVLLGVLLSTLCWGGTAPAVAFEDNNLVYVIMFAGVSAAGLEVQFGNDVPSDDVLQDQRNWLITTVDLQSGQERRFPPGPITVSHTLAGVIVGLAVSPALNPTTHRITVRFQLPNFPEFTIGEPKKKGPGKAFAKAKGKEDADIYFSGTAVGARGGRAHGGAGGARRRARPLAGRSVRRPSGRAVGARRAHPTGRAAAARDGGARSGRA